MIGAGPEWREDKVVLGSLIDFPPTRAILSAEGVKILQPGLRVCRPAPLVEPMGIETNRGRRALGADRARTGPDRKT